MRTVFAVSRWAAMLAAVLGVRRASVVSCDGGIRSGVATNSLVRGLFSPRFSEDLTTMRDPGMASPRRRRSLTCAWPVEVEACAFAWLPCRPAGANRPARLMNAGVRCCVNELARRVH